MPPPDFPGAAHSLEAAYRLFDWRRLPRLSVRQMEQFYEPRTAQYACDELFQALRVADRLHAIYVGLSGCGKSTELTRLAYRVREHPPFAERLLVVHYSVGEVVGLNGVGFSEVTIAMVLQVYAQLEREGLQAPADAHLAHIEEWLTGERTTTRTTRVSAEAGLGGSLLQVLSARLSGQMLRQDEVRMRVQKRRPELLALLKALLEEVYQLTGRRVLFIVDDLEKLTPLDEQMALFLDNAGFFADLPCHFVFTAHSALRLEARYGNEIGERFHEARSILCPVTEGSAEFAAFRNIVHRRLAPDRIATDAVDRAVASSGGLPSHLIDLILRSILKARLHRRERIEVPDVLAAAEELTVRFDYALEDDDYRVLERVRAQGLRSSVSRPTLLHMLAVLEYPDSPTHFALHPLVEPLVERWRARQASPTS